MVKEQAFRCAAEVDAFFEDVAREAQALGVPTGPAMSIPSCPRPQRCPKGEVKRKADLTGMASGSLLTAMR